MVSAQKKIIAQNMLAALEENLEEIRDELGSEDWSRFHDELAPLLNRFTDVTRNVLEMTADCVWQVCRGYPFVEVLILKYSPPRRRKIEAGGTGHEDEESVSEIVNRFQSLLDSLEEMEQLEREQELAERERGPIRRGRQ